jgi:hypothetical protein
VIEQLARSTGRTRSVGSKVRSVLIVQGAFGEIFEPAWNRALNDLGIRAELFETHSLTLPGILGRIERRVLLGPGISRIRARLVQHVKQRRPDVTLFYQGHYFDRETLEQIRRVTFVVGYHDDDPLGVRKSMLRYRHLLPSLSIYRGFHVIRRVNVNEMLAHGVPRVEVLLHSYRPWIHYPVVLDLHDQRHWGSDIVFVGHWEDDMRASCLSAAARAGSKVRIFGSTRYWKPALPQDVYRQVGPVRPVFDELYRKALCGSKIAVAFLSKWNRDEHGMRSFEIPACGAFMLSERTELMRELYEEGKEAEFFSSLDEFLDKIKFYLAHESARVRIAKAGHRRAARSGYDIHSRINQWLQDVNDWREAS